MHIAGHGLPVSRRGADAMRTLRGGSLIFILENQGGYVTVIKATKSGKRVRIGQVISAEAYD